MTIYYVMYAIICAAACIMQTASKDKKKRNKVICTVGFLCIFLLLALRHWSMGVDLGYYSKETGGYVISFKILNRYSWDKILHLKAFLNYEKGYIIFNKLVGSIHNDKQFFLGVCAFINIAVVAIFINKKSKLPLLSWITFTGLPVFLIFFSGMRQCLAISITMLSTYWIEKKKPIKFVLTVLLAWTFHASSILFLAAYPMYHIKLTDIKKAAFVIMIPAVYMMKGVLFPILSRILKDDVEVENTGAGMLFVIFIGIYLVLIFLNSYTKKKEDGYINLFYIACVCQAFSGLNQLVVRVGYYFMIYLIIALPNTIYGIKDDEKPLGGKAFMIGYAAVFGAFLLYGLSAISAGGWAHTNPYVFFWQK